jgi:hypothetical protein
VTRQFRTFEQLSDNTQRVATGLQRGLAAIFNSDIAAICLYGGSLFSPVALDIDLHVLLRRTPDLSDNERIRSGVWAQEHLPESTHAIIDAATR